MRQSRSWCAIGAFVVLFLLCTGWIEVTPAEASPDLTCPSCEDYNVCTIDACDTSTGTCRYDPVDCNDGNPCTEDFCRATVGCLHGTLAAGTACNDGNSCSTGDACNASQQCVGTLLPSGSSCDDGDGCTISDACSAGGSCIGVSLSPGDACEDGSLCTSGETCMSEGGNLICRSPTPACDDSNPCTQDLCDESTGSCTHPPINCDDGNECTGDSCDVATGSCVRTFLSGGCFDGNNCFEPDFCSNGNCFGSGPIGCFDNNICTTDSCDPARGCVFTPGALNCSDGNACTLDFCSQGVGCLHNPPPSCNDGIACTLDSCNPITGACTHLPNCDDGDPCTTDVCDATLGCTHAPAPITLDLKVDLIPIALSPANHKLVPVTATVTAPGFCGGALTITLDSITSSQPDDAAGPTDGHTTGDIQGADLGTADFSFLLRAESDRASATSRVYTITYSASGGGVTDTTSQTVAVLDHHKRSLTGKTEPTRKPVPRD